MLKSKTTISFLLFWCVFNASAQTLSSNKKTLKVEDFPEYLVVHCDNHPGILGVSIRIVIHAKNSEFEEQLRDLQLVLEDSDYLDVSNQTDLLNVLSNFGFDFLNAFPVNMGQENSFSRTGFVFRKKEKFRT
jgi:hypothetical protein